MDTLTTCIWYDGAAEEAARFYTALLPDSRVIRVLRTPAQTPSAQPGDVLVVEWEMAGQRFIGLNGGASYPQTQAVSFVIHTDAQEETDRLWAAITGDGGEEGMCGWCKDRWGVSWQVTPRRLMELVFDNEDPESARRAMEAMMPMRKIDIGVIEAAATAEQGAQR
ncbi:VOC family protein [Sphingosinithalassobacter sp. CS137]|uniref:VOC family protein n=1 Tax=Sphingosinithalassobacter sp. CS137 TaxID=2762748 RepID=UPI00165E4BD9|nr:VOC family protein [Sphingosinithalassobacter sp. CS137]